MEIERIKNNLSHFRSLKCWTQKELAEKVGTTQEMISFYELGVHIPREAMQIKIARALGEEKIETIFPILKRVDLRRLKDASS